jgi:hypothetical protein
VEDERDKQLRADAQAKWRLQEAEERQKRSREDMKRLEEELWKTRHAETARKEEAARRDMEWSSERREFEWRAQHRELELKAEVKQMEWQLDFRKAQSEKELGKKSPPSSSPSSRVRVSLYDAVAAAHDYDDRAPRQARKHRLGQKNRPKSAGSTRSTRARQIAEPDAWSEVDDAVERLVEQAIPRTVSRGFGLWEERPYKGRSSRPSSAAPPSNRSLIDDVAADLDFEQSGSFRERGDDSAVKQGKAHKRSRMRTSHSQPGIGMSYEHVARTVNQQAKPMTLDEVIRSYPEVAQILSAATQ